MANPASGSAPQSAILYQNAQCDVTLIDIPTSIAAAQGRSDILLSTAPLEAPILLHEEPKSEKAKTGQSYHLPDADLAAEYKSIIEKALNQIRQHVPSPWCAPRKLLAQLPKPGKTDMQIDDPEKELENRLREWAAIDGSKGDDSVFDFQKMMAALGATPEDATVTEQVARKWLMSYCPAREIQNDAQHAASISGMEPNAQQEPWVSSFHNPEKHALDLTVFETPSGTSQEPPEYHFTIPPRATFFLSDSTHSEAFRASFRKVTGEYTLPRHFDLVLLDPPWPNRSAKRKGAYEQVGGMPRMKKMLLSMDIDNYLEHNALVGIWITNKEVMRKHILGPGGLFEKWNIGLIEEWIWVKTTVHGEPMFDLDSALRKPYEILLLGRAAPNSWTTMASAPTVKKRVIAAVPDIHSRKPCLKELLEPYIPTANDYSALEIFSRVLVSGWTSWGNEVLKHNSSQYWAPNLENYPAGAPFG
ncbi:MT-A70-domain-containing protein [Lentithecium fluviatile CBS 122367]|uniref:MT-A70-domain-containing protein n=1 Tax=Lentithecium fluviatile CBS 122367 TaxID=1168545 RepID=A0A6G1JLK5_9PLEO|nr:MT-A70-domain-containing protein [Lentithecium fluviatile CBS 122367]